MIIIKHIIFNDVDLCICIETNKNIECSNDITINKYNLQIFINQ